MDPIEELKFANHLKLESLFFTASWFESGHYSRGTLVPPTETTTPVAQVELCLPKSGGELVLALPGSLLSLPVADDLVFRGQPESTQTVATRVRWTTEIPPTGAEWNGWRVAGGAGTIVTRLEPHLVPETVRCAADAVDRDGYVSLESLPEESSVFVRLWKRHVEDTVTYVPGLSAQQSARAILLRAHLTEPLDPMLPPPRVRSVRDTEYLDDVLHGYDGLQAQAINAHGQVAGGAFTAAGNVIAFVYGVGGEAQRPNFVSVSNVFFTALNDHGDAVGLQLSSGNMTAVLWQGDVVVPIGPAAARSSVATAVNSSRQVAGWSRETDGREHAFLYEDGEIAMIGDPAGATSRPIAVSDAGVVTGVRVTTDGATRTFLHADGDTLDLGVPKGFDHVYPHAGVEEGVVIVTAYRRKGRRTERRAFRWSEQHGFQPLDSLSQDRGRRINSVVAVVPGGDVLVSIDDDAGQSVGVLRPRGARPRPHERP